ncbi:MAG: hypothetical protein AB1640_05705 [bacterium]
MFTIQAVGPVPSWKRRQLARLILDPARAGLPCRDEVKSRLRDMRQDAVDRMCSLADELAGRIAAAGGEGVFAAADASEAVGRIREISRGGPIAVNKSSVVTKELVPALAEAGCRVVETYYDELAPFACRFDRSWQLPDVGSSLPVEGIGTTADLVAIRRESERQQGFRGFTGLVGASAVSAREGAVLMLQHGRNVTRIFREARTIVIMAALDKIVPDLDAAFLQTRGMALFGFESLLLGLHGRPERGSGAALDELPIGRSEGRADRSIHMLLLDNGRSALLGGKYRDLLLCIGCRACVKGCAGSQFTDLPGRWSPKEYAESLVAGRSPPDDFCLQCKSCQANCPLGIELPDMIIAAKAELAAGRRRRVGESVLGKMGSLERWASRAPGAANVLIASAPARWLAEKVLDLSRRRELPRVRGATLPKWFRSGKPEP